jgi:(E)-4-hydroxy-3-methylbut-2-enyl-diphosphate synthase
MPIVADIHFHYKRALEAADAGAACLRINPGNIGSSERVPKWSRGQGQWLRDPHRRQRRQPREGPAGKVRRAVPRGAGRKRARHIKLLQDHDFHEYKVAVKASDVFLAVAAYQQLAERSTARCTSASPRPAG